MYTEIRTCIVEKSHKINKRVYTFIRNRRVENKNNHPMTDYSQLWEVGVLLQRGSLIPDLLCSNSGCASAVSCKLLVTKRSSSLAELVFKGQSYMILPHFFQFLNAPSSFVPPGRP